jgi:hypothetical protein
MLPIPYFLTQSFQLLIARRTSYETGQYAVYSLSCQYISHQTKNSPQQTVLKHTKSYVPPFLSSDISPQNNQSPYQWKYMICIKYTQATLVWGFINFIKYFIKDSEKYAQWCVENMSWCRKGQVNLILEIHLWWCRMESATFTQAFMIICLVR